MEYGKAVVNTDGDGAGTGVSNPVYGRLTALRVELGGTPAATTDITIIEEGGLGRTLLALTDYDAADAVFYLAAQAQTPTDGADIAGQYLPIWVGSRFSVTVAQGVADTANAVVVTALVSED